MSPTPQSAWLLAAAALLGVRAPARATPEPGPLEPFELVLQAELVVEGLIADVEPERPPRLPSVLPFLGRRAVCELELGQVLAGFVPGGSPTLEIEQRLERAGAGRYAPYERGQRAVFFLRRPRGADGRELAGPWIVLGTQGEGECPLVGDPGLRDPGLPAPGARELVLFGGAGLQGLRRSSTCAFGHHYYGFAAPRDEFRALVRGLRSCFEWRPRPGPVAGGERFPRATLRRTCSEEELAACMASSELFRAVVRDARALAPRAGGDGS